MPKTPPYPEGFRREAVRLLRRGDRTVPELARDLGCSQQSLRNWSAQFDVDEGRSDGLTSDEREELKAAAAREPRAHRRAPDLEKSRAFFASDSDRTRQ